MGKEGRHWRLQMTSRLTKQEAHVMLQRGRFCFPPSQITFCSFKQSIYILVWPQWWSFGDVSQQTVDFSKKISKVKMNFWFDFHRCSHGLSKIRRHFRNKSGSILKLSKNVFYKKCGPKLIFFSEKKIQKDSNDFWHKKLTWKVKFCHFLTADH